MNISLFLQDALDKFEKGLKLKDFVALPAKVEVLPSQPESIYSRRPPVVEKKDVPTTWLKLTLNGTLMGFLLVAAELLPLLG